MKKLFYLFCLFNTVFGYAQISIYMDKVNIHKDSISFNFINHSEEKIFLFIKNPIISIPDVRMYRFRKDVYILDYNIYKNDSIFNCDILLRMHEKTPVSNMKGIIISDKKIMFNNISILEYTEDCFSKKDSYYIQLIFKQNANYVKKLLSRKEKNYLKKNNIKIFHGTVYSNKVPLIVE